MTSSHKKNIIHFQYCTNCQSHNWNTHHNQAKYHQTYIKLRNLIQDAFKQNSPLIFCNQVPNYFLPIKQQENKYYNPLIKKYVFFPNIGTFQVTLNGQTIFSKKSTNSWPPFQTVLNDISLKILQKPLQFQSKQKKLQTNQTQNQTEFSYSDKNKLGGYRTAYKQEQKNNNNLKKNNNFTLTDHFKTFHHQNNKKISQPSHHFDSNTTIKIESSPKNIQKVQNSNQTQLNINVQDIQGLRKALKTNKQNFNQVNKQKSENKIGKNQKEYKNKNQSKQILINLCSIEQQSNNNIKQMVNDENKFKTIQHKNPSAFLSTVNNFQQVYQLNNSEKSLSLKRFEQFNNDLKQIQKKFKHIQKKINKRDNFQNNQNTLNNESSRVQQKSQNQYDQDSQINKDSRLYRMLLNQNNANNKVNNLGKQNTNYYSYHIQRNINKQNKLPSFLLNPNNFQMQPVKATDRYDERYISPTYYEQNQLNINKKSKKYSEIQKYLKSNNQQKNKKLKRIYGDWKVGANSLHYRKNHRDSMEKNNKNSRNQSNQNSSSSYTQQISSQEEKDKFITVENKQNLPFKDFKNGSHSLKKSKFEVKQQKHGSFIIKHKSSYNKSKLKSPQHLLQESNVKTIPVISQLKRQNGKKSQIQSNIHSKYSKSVHQLQKLQNNQQKQVNNNNRNKSIINYSKSNKNNNLVIKVHSKQEPSDDIEEVAINKNRNSLKKQINQNQKEVKNNSQVSQNKDKTKLNKKQIKQNKKQGIQHTKNILKRVYSSNKINNAKVNYIHRNKNNLNQIKKQPINDKKYPQQKSFQKVNLNKDVIKNDKVGKSDQTNKNEKISKNVQTTIKQEKISKRSKHENTKYSRIEAKKEKENIIRIQFHEFELKLTKRNKRQQQTDRSNKNQEIKCQNQEIKCIDIQQQDKLSKINQDEQNQNIQIQSKQRQKSKQTSIMPIKLKLTQQNDQNDQNGKQNKQNRQNGKQIEYNTKQSEQKIKQKKAKQLYAVDHQNAKTQQAKQMKLLNNRTTIMILTDRQMVNNSRQQREKTQQNQTKSQVFDKQKLQCIQRCTQNQILNLKSKKLQCQVEQSKQNIFQSKIQCKIEQNRVNENKNKNKDKKELRKNKNKCSIVKEFDVLFDTKNFDSLESNLRNNDSVSKIVLYSQQEQTLQNNQQNGQLDKINPIVPYLQLNLNHDSVYERHSHHSFKSSSCSHSSHNICHSQSIKKHSHTSSLYQQPTFSLSPNGTCRCTQRNQQLQTNREKFLSQRKQKHILKQKRMQQNKKRRQIIQKQKQIFLEKLQEERKIRIQQRLKQKQMTKREKLRKAEQKRIQKQRQIQSKRAYKQQNRLQREKQLQQRTKQKEKQIQAKKIQKAKMNRTLSQQKQKTRAESNGSNTLKDQSKAKQSKEAKNSSKDAKQQFSKTETISFSLKKNNQINKNKSYSQVSKNSDQQNKKKTSKQRNKTRAENISGNINNTSYFKLQKQSKNQVQAQNDCSETSIQNETQNRSSNTTQQLKLNSIAIQTINFGQQIIQNDNIELITGKKPTQQKTKRKQSARSRNSQKSIIRNQMIRQIYAPEANKISKTNLSKKSKNSFKHSSKTFKNKNQSSLIQQSQNQNTQRNFFQQQKQSFKEQLSQDQIIIMQQKLQIKFDRQQALILRQLYNMSDKINKQKSKYRNFVNNNEIYNVVANDNSNTSRKQVIKSQDYQQNKNLFKDLLLNQGNYQINHKNIQFIPVEETLTEKRQFQNIPKFKLFGSQSIQIHQLQSNSPYQTRNLHKILSILAQKNQLLIARLFEDYKSQTNFKIKSKNNSDALVRKSKYALWLFINQNWKLIVVDNIIPAVLNQQNCYKPLFSYHLNNQLWPCIIQKCLAVALGGYDKLFDLNVGEIFTMLTGSNHLSYSITQNLSKNKSFLKEITENEKKNFVMTCQRYTLNLKQQNQKAKCQTKIFYLLSKKIVNDGQKDEILFKMREVTVSQTNQHISYIQPYYIKYQKFCQAFKTCEVLHLRQHHNFCSMKLNLSNFNSSKNQESKQFQKVQNNNYFNVVELIFNQPCFGAITVSNQVKSDFKTYLYKLEQSDHQIMKLVGQAQKNHKNHLFFDCCFQQNKYYLFIQSSNSNSMISYMGEGNPQIKIKQQILSNGLRNQSIQYLPVSSYEGYQNTKSNMGKTMNSNLYTSKIDQPSKPKNMDDLREMFLQILLEQRKNN